jgi:hypothetical protein
VARIAGGRVQLYVCDALGYVRALIDAETGQTQMLLPVRC